jgi:hypothetical protein
MKCQTTTIKVTIVACTKIKVAVYSHLEIVASVTTEKPFMI